jgi:hypothetical protein
MSGLTRTENLQLLLERSYAERDHIECAHMVTCAALRLVEAALEQYLDRPGYDLSYLVKEVRQSLLLSEMATSGSFSPRDIRNYAWEARNAER